MKQLNNESIKISVLIITRNRSEMLVGCLDSLVKQTRLPDEVIVVDNSSTDNTKKVILSFKKSLPIRYVFEKQIGIPFARNRGLQHTTGSLILMLDDDCSADKFWVERMAYAHKKYPKAWVVQGRTYSLPKESLYSVVSEFTRFIYIQNYAKKIIPIRSFFKKYFTDEMEILTCATINFSIKTSYLKKHKLSFDTNFYRGEDTDLGRQIMQKNGLIMFCPDSIVGHYERSTLPEFLEQQWHIGRTNAILENKRRNLFVKINIPWSDKFISFLLFCKIFNFSQWHKMPVLIILIFLAKTYRIIGYFFEKRILTLEKQ